MYIHIGNNKNIRNKFIIGIFDSDTATVAAETKEFLKNKQNNNKLFASSENLPKAFVLTRQGEVWFSQISTGTLAGRGKKL